jgi:chromosome segregation ATPase
MKGCMNCGNISCGNNKKRDCAGCGRWISPEDKIAELEEKVGMAERTRDRLKAMGFPTLASCKEYSAKLETLEKENERLTVDYETLKLHDEEEIAQLRESFHDYREQVKNDNESIKEWKEKALKIMRDISACELMKVITKAKQYEALENLENFLREIPEDSK